MEIRMNKVYFIVNPAAGSGMAKREFVKVSALLDARGTPYRVVFTERPMHATELAREAVASGEKLIAAVGGDGTVNEVAGALCNTDAVLAALPFGTGNDLMKVVGFAKEPEAIVDELISGTVRKMDAAFANGKLFINVAGLGFDVDVLIKTEKYKKKLNGMFPYMLGILDALTHLKTLRLTVSANGETVKCKGIILSVGNGQYIGGGMRAVPMADPFDGWLDVCYVDKISVPRFLTLLPSFIKGEHVARTDIVHHIRTRELTVETEESCMLNLDGEVVGGTPVVFTIAPGALNVLLPRENS